MPSSLVFIGSEASFTTLETCVTTGWGVAIVEKEENREEKNPEFSVGFGAFEMVRVRGTSVPDMNTHCIILACI